jgi:pyruvate-ferredoxin/flavodoxin oxidoreductase
MFLGQKAIRERLISKVKEMMDSEKASDEFKAVAQAFIDTKDNGKANEGATKALIVELEKAANAGCPTAKEILSEKDYLSKKSVWIFGGDGWAYDIGFGGLDHVLASGEDVNVMVFDTEVYSNTGGQASKASNLGQVAQFAAAGKAIGKKNLAEIAMSYGYVYVAQIAMGADPAQTIKAMAEAEAYPGPSLIIGYAPCEMHGLKGGMTNCQGEMKKAVEAGYWQMFRFNPALKAEGKNPFSLDSKEPKWELFQDYLKGEVRFASVAKQYPKEAEELFQAAQENAQWRYKSYLRMLGTEW